jgi:hypothetical protein
MRLTGWSATWARTERQGSGFSVRIRSGQLGLYLNMRL